MATATITTTTPPSTPITVAQLHKFYTYNMNEYSFSDSKSGACHVQIFFPLATTILRGVVVVAVDTIAVRIGFVFIQNLYNIKHIMCIQCTMWEK